MNWKLLPLVQAKDFLELPEVMSYVVDPELKHFSYDDLQAICEAVNLCFEPDPSKRVSMKEICNVLESKIDTSVSAELKASSLAWAELALSSNWAEAKHTVNVEYEIVILFFSF